MTIVPQEPEPGFGACDVEYGEQGMPRGLLEEHFPDPTSLGVPTTTQVQWLKAGLINALKRIEELEGWMDVVKRRTP